MEERTAREQLYHTTFRQALINGGQSPELVASLGLGMWGTGYKLNGRKSECGKELIMMILGTVVGRLKFRRFIDAYMLLCDAMSLKCVLQGCTQSMEHNGKERCK